MAQHNELGEWGEQMAREYLLTEGYIIHKRDERMRGKGEIDIIAFKDGEVVFVEVKTRREADTDPMEVFDHKRRVRMCRAADTFIRVMNLDLNPRFDIIIVNGTPVTGHKISHYPDAFLPPLNGECR